MNNKWIKTYLIISALLALMSGLLFTTIGLENNKDAYFCEYFGEGLKFEEDMHQALFLGYYDGQACKVNIIRLLPLFLFGYFLAFAMLQIPLVSIYVYKKLKKRIK